MFYSVITLLSVHLFLPRVHKFPDTVRIIFFRLGVKPFLHRLVHDRYSFVMHFPSLLILWLSRERLSIFPLTRNSCCNQWQPRTRIINETPPPSEFFQPFANFHLAHTVVAIYNCHYSINFTSLHTLWLQISRHRSSFFFDAFCEWIQQC